MSGSSFCSSVCFREEYITTDSPAGVLAELETNCVNRLLNCGYWPSNARAATAPNISPLVWLLLAVTLPLCAHL